MARTDNDGWDLASSVGATATSVAASRALASQGPDPLINDPFAEPLVRAVGVDSFTRLVGGDISLEDEDPALNERRIAEGTAVRTRFFDDFFTDATAAGVRQAVILAAGLDSRGYRLPWPAGTVVYEVDQPRVIEFKTKTLTHLGATPAADWRAVGIDLRDDWPAALRDNGFDSTQPTAWIAEGLLVYLPPDAQDRLFDNITVLSAVGSRVATDYVLDTTLFTDERWNVLTQRLRHYGFKLDISDLVYQGERSHVIEYLKARGWQSRIQTTPELYAANGFALPDDGTMAAFADFTYLSATLTAQHP